MWNVGFLWNMLESYGNFSVNLGTCDVGMLDSGVHTAKTKCRKFETNIPRKEISGPQSQFPHSCVCEQIIHIFP
jgi:hypothetical protein